MANTDAFEAQILNHLFRGTAISAFTPYIALLLEVPGDSPTRLVEPPAPYARISLASAMGQAATAGSITSDGTITFAQNTGPSYRVLAVGIVDHATATIPTATLKAYAECDVTVGTNGTPVIPAAQLRGFEE